MESLVTPIQSVVARHGEKMAVLDVRGARLTYAELWREAGRVAQSLRTRGVSRGDRVALCCPKECRTVAVILGILRAGGIYVPLDPSWPDERIRQVVEDCEPRHVIGAEEEFGASPLREEVEPAGQEGAYLLYTSGSTGRPKGVLHSHSSLGPLLQWGREELRPGTGDRFLSQAGFHFDLSTLDLFLSLGSGATLVVLDREWASVPQRVLQAVETFRPTLWYTTPTALNQVAEFARPTAPQVQSLRCLLFAGEVFSPRQLRAWRNLLPDADLFNLYGPTETNVCTAYRIPATVEADRGMPYPIGRVLPGFEARVDPETELLWVRERG